MAQVEHLLGHAASQKPAAALFAVQNIVDDVRVDLDSHVGRVLFRKWRVAHVADGDGGAAHEDDFVAEGFRGCLTAHDVPHRIVRVGSVGTRVIDQLRSIGRLAELVGAELNRGNAIFTDVSNDILIGDFFVFAHDLQIE